MPRISNNPHFLTPEQRAEIIQKQIEREPERLRCWNQERERQIAAEKERSRWDGSTFPRLSYQ